MKKTLTILTLTALSFASCKKEDTPKNIFAGTWKSHSIDTYHNNVFQETEIDNTTIVVLSDCVLSNNNFCDATIKETSSSHLYYIKYSVTDGNTLFIIDEDNDITTTDDRIASEIILINDSQFHFANSYINEDMSGNSVTVKEVYKMVKQ